MLSERRRRQRGSWDHYNATGFTLIELVFALALSVVLAGVAIPVGADAIDDMRTRAAARYVSGRIAISRIGAINRSRVIGLRFVPASPDYQFGAYVDGNGGNIAIRVGEDIALCTPTLVSKGFMKPEDMCLVDFEGAAIE